MKRKLTFGALFMCLVMLITSVGCANTNYVAKVNGEEIPWQDQVFYLMKYKNQAQGTAGEDVNISSVWDMKVSEDEDAKTYAQTINEAGLDYCVNNLLVEQKLKEYGIYENTAQEQEQMDAALASLIEQSGGKEKVEASLKVFGLSMDDFNRAYQYTVNYAKLVRFIYGKDGIEAIDESAVTAYFSENYVRVKHILIQVEEDADDQTKAAAKQKAEDLLASVKGGADFDALMAQESQDPGSATNPDGYIFTAAASYVQPFKEAAFDMEVGEYRLVESSYGWHIMKKCDLFEKAAFLDTYRDSIVEAMSAEDMQKSLDSWKAEAAIEYNDKAIEKYSIKNIGE